MTQHPPASWSQAQTALLGLRTMLNGPIDVRQGQAFIDWTNFVLTMAGASPSGLLPEAPTDGTIYGRQNLDWTPITSGGGTPGGANTDVQFNNASAFGGDSGFTYAGNGQATLALGTIAANAKALNITGTFNNAAVTFDAPLFLNVTDTASLAHSKIMDLQIGGTQVISVEKFAIVNLQFGGFGSTSFGIDQGGSGGLEIDPFNAGLTSPKFWFANSFVSGGNQLRLSSDTSLSWSAGANVAGSNADVFITRDVAGILAQRNGTNAQSLRVYNTFTDASNYERGVMDWTTIANALTIGVQVAGTGAGRAVYFRCGAGQSFNWLDGNTPIMQYFSGTLIVGGGIGNPSLALGPAGPACAIEYNAARVIRFTDGTGGGTLTGWYQWAGQARVTADFTVTSSTALTNVTGLSVNVQAGRTYQFETELYVTDAAAGGVQAAIGGTATATNIQYTGYTIADNAIKGKTNATALATAVGSTLTTETTGIITRITGTITVNAAGTLTVQMAQNTANATPTTAKRGSWLLVNDMP